MANETPIFILDGGLGTTLEDKYNVTFTSADTPLWSSHLLLTDQDTLFACHRDFAEAGADVITTATYQTSITSFKNTRTGDYPDGVPQGQIARYVGDAVSLANRAGDNKKQIALSLGPYGATMVPSQEYSGKYDEEHSSLEALTRWHIERLSVLSSAEMFGQVSYVVFETIPRWDEILAIRKAMEESVLARVVNSQLPYAISCVFPGDEEVPTLPDGTSARDAVNAVFDRDISNFAPWAIGINCTKVSKLPVLVRQYEEVVLEHVRADHLESWPALILYPDGTNGEVYNTTTQKWELPDGQVPPKVSWESQLAEMVQQTIQRGRWSSVIVGGCCKASPDDIARLRAALKLDGQKSD